jgi:molybdopterin molybdotransferase
MSHSEPHAEPHAESYRSASVSVADHRARILQAIAALPPATVSLANACGRTLVGDLLARVDVPSFDNSAMDGYALRRSDAAGVSADYPVRLRVVADVPAGSPENPPIRPGEAVRIMTGAPIPADADCVVPVEDTDAGTADVNIYRYPAISSHIRRAGSDARAGDLVLPAGRTLSSRDVAAAAATGTAHLSVYPAPRVGVLSTGTELRPPGEHLAHGQIYDSNSILLAAAVAECGGIPIQLGSVPDDEETLRAILEDAAPDVDAFVTSGGVSVGAYDVVKALLAPAGVWFGPVRMRPGKPQGFGMWPGRDADTIRHVGTGTGVGTPIFTLPGNPVSVFVSFEVFVRPALLAMQGKQSSDREVLRGTVGVGWSSAVGRTHFMPAIAERLPDGTLSVRPASDGGSGSHLVASLARANALARVPEVVGQVRIGDEIDVVLLT